MKHLKWIIALLVLLAAAAVIAVASQNKGPSDLSLNGGKTGDIPFPHASHQTALKGDCMICHDLFPQESGAIEAYKAEEKLKKQQVMNTLCLKCHRAMKKEGSKTGPTSCKGCHVKK